MKKLISVILALVMVMSMATFVSAESGEYAQNGSITINKYNEDNEYAVYRMLNLESYNTDGKGSYTYLINTGWEDFFTNGGAGEQYITIENGYVSWKSGVTDTLAAEFAEKALKYAEDRNIVADAVSDKDATENRGTTTEGYDTYKFSNLWLGYYLVDSTMGSLCGLTTTNPNASVNAKNGEPTIEKHVKEDSNSQWGTANSADIGEKVEYRVTITVQPGAEDYILHDNMAGGLTFNNDITVEYNGTPVAASGNYEVKTTGLADDCDFEVVFSETFCDSLETGKSLIVYYSASVNTNAVIAGDGNENIAQLEFGDGHFTTQSKVTTKAFAFDLVKTDAQNSLLDGAKFEMYRKINGVDTIVNLIKVELDNGKYYYRPALEGEANAITEFLVEGGMIRFQGFDSGDYYFKETEQPKGYNILTEMVKFSLGDVNKDAIFNDGVYSSGSGFHITNQAGTMLPETGAMGTVLFVTFGTIAVLAAGVLLVTKKRMAMIQE